MTVPTPTLALSPQSPGAEPGDLAFSVFLTDPSGNIAGWSPGAARITGYTAASIVGQELSVLYPADALREGHPFTDLATAARRGRAIYEGRIIQKNGESVWAEVVLTALRDAGGMVSGFACSTRDLSIERAAQAQRTAHAEQLTALTLPGADSAASGLELAALLPRIVGRARDLTHADAAMLELRDGVGERARAHSGLREFDIELGSVLMPYGGVAANRGVRILRYDDRHESPEILGDVCDRAGIGAMLAIPLVHENTTLGWLAVLSRSAHAFDEQQMSTLELMSTILGSPVAQAQAAEARRALVAERARAQAAHRESEARFRAAMDSSLDALFIVSAVRDASNAIVDFALLDANKCAQEMTGVQRDGFEGKALSGLRTVARRLASIPQLASVVESAVPAEQERQTTDASGKTIWVQEQIVPFGDGAMITVRDVTSRVEAHAEVRRARELAEAANRAKTDFVAKMSHELRTPLNSVIGFSNILLRNKRRSLDEGELSYLQRIQGAGTHLLSLINDVLDLAKVEAGRMSLELSTVDLVALARGVIAQLDPSASAGGLILQLDSAHEALYVEADDGKLRQVLLNLVGNAIKFTPFGVVTVRISARPDQGTGLPAPTSIDIADSGIGIPEDRLTAIFDAFEQAESSTSRRYGGTGLGLSISKALCEAMGFTLTVTSRLGSGSSFRIGLIHE